MSNFARQHQDRGLSRTFVAVPADEPGKIFAYYALTLTEVDASSLPEHRRRELPRVIPGVRLARLAVDVSCQGIGLGELMLMNCLERVRHITAHAGVVGLFVDALDQDAARFYLRYGFEPFQDQALKLFLPLN